MKGPKRTEKDKKKSFKKAYLTKSQACRYLQISARDFRRLAILKGIYPREPKRFAHSQGKDKQYFFRKDINWLARDSTLETLRKYKTWRRKLNHHIGRKDLVRARDYQKHLKPQMDVAHIIRERYPTFVEAVRDLDDALAHICLYAMLPPQLKSDSTVEGHGYLTTGMSTKARNLVKRWMQYVAKAHAVRKCFISIKGFYFQAEIMGETVTWLMPFEFTCRMPNDVDYYAMMSFLEFYTVYLDHVLFKLEADHRKKQQLEEQRLEEAPGDEAEEKEADITATLFKDEVFHLGRETPQAQLRLLVESFGGRVAKEEKDSGITKYVIDRPQTPAYVRPNVDCVQPQWVFDCVNKRELVHVEQYMVGSQLPPHMSPFEEALQHRVEWEALKKGGEGEGAEGIRAAAAKIRAAALQEDDEEDRDSDDSGEFVPDENLEDEGIVTSDEDESEGEDDQSEEEKPQQKAPKGKKAVAAPGEEPVSKLQLKKADRALATKRQREQEEIALKLELATNKKRKLYKTIQRTKQRKENEKENLAKRFHELGKKGEIKGY